MELGTVESLPGSPFTEQPQWAELAPLGPELAEATHLVLGRPAGGRFRGNVAPSGPLKLVRGTWHPLHHHHSGDFFHLNKSAEQFPKPPDCTSVFGGIQTCNICEERQRFHLSLAHSVYVCLCVCVYVCPCYTHMHMCMKGVG